jgi:hypothetical protein
VRATTAPLVGLLLVGCPIVTSGDLNDRIDVDGDGQASVAWGGADCDDEDPTIGPHVNEVAGNEIDEDCDGLLGCYLDSDRDGFGAVGGTVVKLEACTPELGGALDTTDCDDADPDVNLDGVEVAGGEIDEDCDGRILCFVDADRDGYGINADVLASGLSCERVDQEAPQPGDCDDSEPTANPGATEVAGNDIDEDCVGGPLCPTDGDSDGDQVCDGLDRCDGGNDALDADGDGAPDDCDPDDTLTDTDGDGLLDGIELVLGSDPTDTDSDDDGLPDGLEDADGDGMIGVTETDPADPDTNDDGVCDSPRLDNDSDGLDPVDACRSVWFVDDDAAPGGLGISWATALRHPQDALDLATADHEVWVAAGVYLPDLVGPVVQMTDGVDLYGGWAGTEATFDDRPDPLLPTVLDADVGPPGSLGDAPHVVMGASDALLDGFELNGGTANSLLLQGGSLHVPSGTTGLTVQATRMSNGSAQAAGGCVFNAGELTLSDVQLVDCTTTIGDGGGLYSAGTLTWTDGIVQFASAPLAGGGIHIGAGDATLTRVLVVDNTATDGGGIAVGDGASLTAVLVDLQRNDATNTGGGLYADQSAEVSLISSTVATNTAIEGSAITLLYVDDAALHGVSVADHPGTALLQRADPTSPVRIENSVFYSLVSATDIDAAEVEFVATCLTVPTITPPGVIAMADDPFARPVSTPGPVAEYRLKHLGLQPTGTVCVDAGDSMRADMVYAAVGLDWRQLSTATDNRLDVMEVDVGRHYEP